MCLMLASPTVAAPFRIAVTEAQTPLVPNSVIDLSAVLGYYRAAGVDVDIVRLSPLAAVAALRTGEVDMANLSVALALNIVREQRQTLIAVVSPDNAMGYMIVADSSVSSLNELDGKAFGVSGLNSVDRTLTRLVLDKFGVEGDRLNYVALGQPLVRTQALVGRQIAATTLSLGAWLALKDKKGLQPLVSKSTFQAAAPVIAKANFVGSEARAAEIKKVVLTTMVAARVFAADPAIWVSAMQSARPDVNRRALEAMARDYVLDWRVNGGLNAHRLEQTEQAVAGAHVSLANHSYIEAVLKMIGIDGKADPL
jgi:NitT/TauT family transport system substrate-binding protein